jgi:hypothetical protein
VVVDVDPPAFEDRLGELEERRIRVAPPDPLRVADPVLKAKK